MCTSPTLQTEQCCDYVSVSNGTVIAGPATRISGDRRRSLPGPFYSLLGSNLTVAFFSDSSVTDLGVTFTFDTVDDVGNGASGIPVAIPLGVVSAVGSLAVVCMVVARRVKRRRARLGVGEQYVHTVQLPAALASSTCAPPQPSGPQGAPGPPQPSIPGYSSPGRELTMPACACL